MPGRSRPRPTRSVSSFEDPTLLMPAELVVDTSFVVEALIPNQPHHTSAREFLERLTEAETTLFFNRLLELELAEAAFRIALLEQHGKKWARMRHDGRSRRRGRALLGSVGRAWNEVLDAIPWTRIEVDEVVDRVPELMSRYGLSSYDAVHAGTALFAGVSELIALDVGFAAVPEKELTIFVDRSRLARCRELREGMR